MGPCCMMSVGSEWMLGVRRLRRICGWHPRGMETTVKDGDWCSLGMKGEVRVSMVVIGRLGALVRVSGFWIATVVVVIVHHGWNI